MTDGTNSRALFLFDLDGTVLWSGKATAIAMTAAFADLFGVEDAFAGVELQFAGRTDAIIFREALIQHAIEGDIDELLERLRTRYKERLPEALAQVHGQACPGVPDLLKGLADAGASMGLVTGNARDAATLKLKHCGVDPAYFQDGGFGDDHEDRSKLVTLAMERVGGDAYGRRVVLVGDTPNDINAARANELKVACVGTGNHTAEQLLDAGADIAYPDFSDWKKALTGLLDLADAE